MKKLSRLRSLGKERVMLGEGAEAWWVIERSAEGDERSGDMESMQEKGISKHKSWSA